MAASQYTSQSKLFLSWFGRAEAGERPYWLARQAFWRLPYNWRRPLFALLAPGVYRRWQALRKYQTVDSNETSLLPFDQYSCIFVHIPKCAGVSVSKALFGNLGGGHCSITQYQLIFEKRLYEAYFKFAFVRNPWDRLVSAYAFLAQGGLNQRDEQWFQENLSAYPDFGSFVRGWINPRNIYTYYHFVPQYVYLCEPGSLSPGVDFLGHYESIDQDFQVICRSLGLNSSLSRSNVTARRDRDYRTYYNAETKSIVERVYQKDIIAFDYGF
jgi:hypothetical protein